MVNTFIVQNVTASFWSLKRTNTPNLFLKLKPALARADYLSLPMSQRYLIAQARFCCTNAKSDDARPPAPCRLCADLAPETIYHLTTECNFFQVPRASLWSTTPLPTDPAAVWVTQFTIPLPRLILFFQTMDTLFFLRLGSKLFTHPNTFDLNSDAFISRQNAVINFHEE